MKCARKGCDGNLGFIGYASMGCSHSNYYKCNKCGNIYEIYDHSIGVPSRYILRVEGMKCLLHKIKYGYFAPCQRWGCPRVFWDEVSWADRDYDRNFKNCGYRLKWSSKRKTPKREPPRELTYLERNALRVAELREKLDGKNT